MNFKKCFLKTILALPMLGIAGLAFGQTWNFVASDEGGLPGDVVEVTVTIEHVGDEEAWAADLQVGDLSAFSNVDFSQCMSAFPPAFIQTCGFRPAPNDDVIRIQWSSDAAGNSWPASAEATLLFEIDGGATVGDIVDLTWIDTNVNGTADTTDGSIEILDVPPEELSELSVSPDPLAFGTVDLGNMPVTDTVTAENTGGSNSSLTISGVVYSGDAEFSVVNDACTGSTLNFGETCDVTVEFNAGANGNFTGQLDFSSDANTNPNPTVSITGAADSVPNLTVNPPFGPVNLGTGLQGSTVSANGSISNSGSAPGDFDCTLNDPNGVYSTDPSPLTGTVPAGESVDFSLSCTLPPDAEDGDVFEATLSCTGDIQGTHDLSCGVSEFEPLPVPTMQKWGLIVLTLMMLMIGGLSIRFFRA